MPPRRRPSAVVMLPTLSDRTPTWQALLQELGSTGLTVQRARCREYMMQG